MKPALTLLLLSLFGTSLTAADSDMVLVIHNYQDQSKSQGSWQNGIWLWPADLSHPQLLLPSVDGSPTSVNSNDAAALKKSFVAYENSQVAASPNGRYLAISSLVMESAPKLVDRLPLPDDLKKRFGAKESTTLQIARDQYKILLIDLQALKNGASLNEAVFIVFDTSKYKKPTAIPVDKNLRFGLRTEFPKLIDFNFGENARLAMSFTDPTTLKLRVFGHVPPKNSWSDNGRIERWNTRYTDPVNLGVGRSFAIDVTYPDYPEVFSSMVEGETYFSKSSVADDKSPTRWELLNLSHNRKRLLRYHIATIASSGNMLTGRQNMMSHSVSIFGTANQHPLDDVVVCRNKTEYPNAYNDSFFIPHLFWSDDDEVFTVVNGTSYQSFALDDVVQADSIRSCLATKSLQTAPDFEGTLDSSQLKQIVFDNEFHFEVLDIFKWPRYGRHHIVKDSSYLYFAELSPWMRSLYYYDVDSSNKTPFNKPRWLCRIAVGEDNEAAIERLSPQGWSNNMKDTPIPGVVSYSLLISADS